MKVSSFNTGRNCTNPDCKQLLVVRVGESSWHFNRRMYCSTVCSHKVNSANRRKRQPGPIKHGSVAGYKRCHLEPGGACDPCREAQTRDGKERRADGEYQRRRTARGRALSELAKRYPDDFAALLDKEMTA